MHSPFLHGEGSLSFAFNMVKLVRYALKGGTWPSLLAPLAYLTTQE
jgi:hypothetical protein